MAMSIGVDNTAENWKTCLMENGQTSDWKFVTLFLPT